MSVRVAVGGKPKSLYQTLSFTHLKGERIRFLLVRIEAPSQQYSGLDQEMLGPPTSIIIFGALRGREESA